jgi:type VI secretion system secreted protein VgrG
MATSSTPVPEAKFVVDGLGEDDLIFRRMQGIEELGRLPEYRIELHRLSKSAPIAAADVLGKPGCVHLRLPDDSFRYIHALVTRFERGGAIGSYDIYHVEMRPWLWALTLGADCRVYPEKTVKQIIEAVFGEYQGTFDASKLEATYRTRPYTVQYRETDFEFVARLMEEEGIYYYFKHTATQHTLVLCDGPGAHLAIPGSALLWAAVQTEKQWRTDVVRVWSQSHNLASLKYTHTDYAAEVPATSLLAEATRTADYPAANDFEVFDYPGGYEDLKMASGTASAKTTEGTRLAQLRVDAFESTHIVASGLSPCRHVAPGWTFSFADYPKLGDAAVDYLVTGANYDIEFAGQEAYVDSPSAGFSCRFDAVPKDVKYQPPPVARRPLVHGPQTATVIGSDSDTEIHTDEFGRVKVAFHWDRVGNKDASKTCWVRVATPWASNTFGMVSLPRVGDEVVVTFLEGNPDRPLITGSVYNGTNKPPYTLPTNKTVSGIKTRSSDGGAAGDSNELRFDDKAGSEYIWLQAQKDFHRLVKNDSWDTVQNDKTIEVTKNEKHKVGEHMTMEVGKTVMAKVGEDVYAKLGADLTMDVTGAFGFGVGEAIDLEAGQAIKITAGQGLDIDAGQAIKITGGGAVHIKGMGIVIDGGSELTLKAGSGIVKLSSGGVEIVGAMVKINCGGGAGPANAAAKASPAAPEEPEAPPENTDPLA